MADSSLPVAPRPRRARWVDALSTTFVAASILGVLAAAWPAVVRAAGWTSTSLARRPMTVVHPRGILEDEPRQLALDDDDDDEPTDDLERLFPEPENWAGKRAGDDPPAPIPGARLAAVLEPQPLLLEPGKLQGSLGTIVPGDVVRVMKEDGGWALVLKSGVDGVEMGWVRATALAIR